MDIGAWQATVHRVAKSQTRLKQLSMHAPELAGRFFTTGTTWGFSPGSGRSSGEGNSDPLQYSCLGNPMDRGPWQATVQGMVKE